MTIRPIKLGIEEIHIQKVDGLDPIRGLGACVYISVIGYDMHT